MRAAVLLVGLLLVPRGAYAEFTTDAPAHLSPELLSGPFPSVEVWCAERRADSSGGVWSCDPDSDGHLAGKKTPSSRPRGIVDARVVTIIETTKEARRETTSGQLYVAVRTARGWFFSTPVVVAISGEHNDFFLRVTRFETAKNLSALRLQVQHQDVAASGDEERNRDWTVWVGVGASKSPSLVGPVLLAESRTGSSPWEVAVSVNRGMLKWSTVRGTAPDSTAALMHPMPIAFP